MGQKKGASYDLVEKIRQVREIIRKKNWCNKVHIIERSTNVGLAENIIKGVTEIINKFGKIIVLEDDIVTSQGFLKYMNEALNFYDKNEKVMHISGYMYPHEEKLPETFFFNVPLCWGWATWKRSWESFNNDANFLWQEIQEKKELSILDKFGGDYLSSQLAHNITGRLNTWFIKWHTSVLLQNGFTLYPSISLVENIGFDNSGIHNGEFSQFKIEKLADNIEVYKIELKENEIALNAVQIFYKELNKKSVKDERLSLKKMIKKGLRRLFVKIYPELNNIKTKNKKIENNSSYLGNDCKVYPDAILNKTIIGSYTYIAKNSIINNSIIGKFCSIGPNLIAGWGIHPTNGISTHPMFYSTLKQNGMTLSKTNKVKETLPIVIGNDVFIGMNVIILDGVKIGNGAVIGAGAVVSKNIPDYAIAVGNPIKIIRYRFDDITIDKLLGIKWWDLDHDNLELVEKYFFDVEKYLETNVASNQLLSNKN